MNGPDDRWVQLGQFLKTIGFKFSLEDGRAPIDQTIAFIRELAGETHPHRRPDDPIALGDDDDDQADWWKGGSPGEPDWN